jgi:hypothetical protein
MIGRFPAISQFGSEAPPPWCVRLNLAMQRTWAVALTQDS